MEKKMTKAERILRFIGAHPQGLRLGEISKFIHDINHPHMIGKKHKVKVWRKDKLVETEKPAHAGYYGTNLCGNGMGGQAGLLELFCTKTADRRYVLTEKIKAPFYGKERKTRTLELNVAHREREYKLHCAMSAKCRACEEASHRRSEDFFTADGEAHHTQWGRGYRIDCVGRVWTGRHGTVGQLTTLTGEKLHSFSESIRNVKYDLQDALLEQFVRGHLK
jgi:hypothetical protein